MFILYDLYFDGIDHDDDDDDDEHVGDFDFFPRIFPMSLFFRQWR